MQASNTNFETRPSTSSTMPVKAFLKEIDIFRSDGISTGSSKQHCYKILHEVIERTKFIIQVPLTFNQRLCKPWKIKILSSSNIFPKKKANLASKEGSFIMNLI